MDPSDIDLKPRDVTEDEWISIPPGVRVRRVRNHQYELDLSPEQYETLYRLPYWMLYGPEHGLPAGWFNPDGFLLPKYRPGGGRFGDFRKWRRWYRSHRWLHYKIEERFRMLRERYKTAYAVGAIVLFIALYFASERIALSWLGEGPHYVALYALVFVIYGVGLFLLARLQRAFVRRRVVKRWAKRQGSPAEAP